MLQKLEIEIRGCIDCHSYKYELLEDESIRSPTTQEI